MGVYLALSIAQHRFLALLKPAFIEFVLKAQFELSQWVKPLDNFDHLRALKVRPKAREKTFSESRSGSNKLPRFSMKRANLFAP